MKKVTVIIEGKAYPCRSTMGAMLRFKEVRGKDVSEMDGTDLGDLMAFLYCCVKSACARERVDFPYTYDDFTDSISPEEFQQWSRSLESDGNDDGEKKRKAKP